MKNAIKLIIGCFLILCFQQEVMAAERAKMGMVDMERFQAESIAFQKIRNQLKERFNKLQEKLNKEEVELRQIEEDLKKQSMMLSFEAKEDKKKELEKKRRHYKYLIEEFTQQMKDAEMEATRRVGKEVEEVVLEIGKRDGYIMILERRTVGLLYFDTKHDITDEVIRMYDRGHQ